MDLHIGYIMTVSNSIIGVSILAMPFCFKQCGILLAIVMLLASSILSRLTCHFLLKAATLARRRTFELLAFHTFGIAGKFIVELGIIGFQMGTCIAFFVIIGDLGPAIIAKIMETYPTDTLRTTVLVCVALFCVLPLGLLKNVESLGSVSTATIGFYFCLVLKTIAESGSHFASGDWMSNVELWRPIGILQCLPIFAMALSCQTQLFEIYETLPNASLDKMNYVVRVAVNICVSVYVCVGFFGYIAFSSHQFTGNILMSFSPSVMTDAMKIGFVLSIAFSFPLVIFPCRASLYSLLFKKGYTPYDGVNNFIPETRFKLLTVFVVGVSLVIGIMIPNIEVVLGLLGSTIGTMICVIFPVTCFICISTKNTNERLLAQLMLFIGVIVMVLGTYANLYAMEEIKTAPLITEKVDLPLKGPLDLERNLKILEAENKFDTVIDKIIENKIEEKMGLKIVDETPILNIPKVEMKNVEIRHEPPQPEEPEENIITVSNKEEKVIKKVDKELEMISKLEQQFNNRNKEIKANEVIKNTKKPEEMDKAAIEKEDKELLEAEKDKTKEGRSIDILETTKQIKDEPLNLNKHDEGIVDEFKKEHTPKGNKAENDLLATLKKHKEEQQILIKEQKQILEEIKKEKKELKDKQLKDINDEKEMRRKAASQIVEIAKKAIESLEPKTDTPILKEEVVKTPEMNNPKPVADIANKISSKTISSKPMVPLPIMMSHISNYNKNIVITSPSSNSISLENNAAIKNIKIENNEPVSINGIKQNTFEQPKLVIDKTVGVKVIVKPKDKNNTIMDYVKAEKLSVGRDILAENTERSDTRNKRDAEVIELSSEINEKCEKTTEKQNLPELLPDLDKKSNVFRLENSVIEAALKTNSLDLKRKRK